MYHTHSPPDFLDQKPVVKLCKTLPDYTKKHYSAKPLAQLTPRFVIMNLVLLRHQIVTHQVKIRYCRHLIKNLLLMQFSMAMHELSLVQIW